MAHKVNGASLGPIYERLNDAGNYHPLDAETFADWSMEAGDVVTVSRDGKEYASPVHTSTMTWRGRTPVVSINASGKQRRDPPAKVSRQKFSRSGAGMRNIQGIYYEMTSEDGILNSSILMTSSILRTEFNNSISDVHSFIEETADHIRSDVYASSSQIYSSIQQTASNLRVEFGNAVSDLHTVIETTADGIRSDVYASSSQLYSSIQQTASNLRVEIGNAVSGLNSVIETTAEGVRSEFNNAISDVHTVISETAEGIRSDVYASSSQIYSAIQQTASNFRIELGNAVSDLHAVIETTADGVRSDVYASSSQIYSAIQQTASNFRIELGNAVSDLHTVIETTAEGVRSDVYASSSQIYSAIQQTASNFRIELGNAVSDLHVVIETTADGVRSDVYASSSQIYSAIQQTASNFRIELGNAVSDLHAVIESTADGVRSDVYASSSQIYSSIRQTASSIRSEIGNTISNVYTSISQTANNIILEVKKGARVFHQYSDPSLTEDVKNGDIWVKDSMASTHGSAGSFTYGQLGSFRYADLYGQEIYVRKGGSWVGPIGGSQAENISRARIEEAEDHIAIITDNMGGDYAEFVVEMGRIRSRVEDVEAGLESTIEQTASMIRSAVFTANSTMYSEIIQTQSMIKTEVYNSESKVYSEIKQTANNISLVVSHKRAQYIQQEDPSLTHTMYDGDLWIVHKGNIYTHAAMNTLTHGSLGAVQYMDYMGKTTKVWKGGVWLPYYDERAQHIDETRVDINENGIYLLKGDLSEQYAQFQVERNQIRSIVQDKIEGVGTQITQTARDIRSEAWASSSKIYTSIVQTASNIRADLHNAVSDLHAEIDATAGYIRSAVYASSSQLYSVIMQTASGVESRVGNKISGVESKISQQADRISLVVSGTGSNAKIRPAQIVAAINAQTGSSSVLIDADHVRLNASGTVKLSDALSVSGTDVLLKKTMFCAANIAVTGTYNVSFEDENVWLNGASLATTIKSASVTNNTLTLTTYAGEEINFSKATTLTPSWSGSAFPLTMAAKQTNSGTQTTVASKTIGFGGLVTSHDIELQLANGGTPTKVANVSNIISCPVKVQQLTANNPVDRYSKDVQFSVASLFQEKSVTSNGTYNTFDTGKMAYSKVVVDITPTASASVGSNKITFTISPKNVTKSVGFGTAYNANAVDVELVSNGGLSKSSTANCLDVPIKVQRLNGGSTSPTLVYSKILTMAYNTLLETKEVSSNGTYNTFNEGKIGYSKVVVDIDPTLSGKWSSGAYVITPNIGTHSFDIGFGGDYGDHNLEITTWANGSAERKSATVINVPVAVGYQTGPTTSPVLILNKTLAFNAATLLETPSTITKNGTYTPNSDDGYIGFKSVAVSITPSLSGSLTGSVFTVQESIKKGKYEIGFGNTYGAHNTDFGVFENGSATRYSATQISVPVYVGKLNEGSTQPTSAYTKTLHFNFSPTLSGSLSGSVFTVKPNVGSSTYEIGFGNTYGAHDTDFGVYANGNASLNSSTQVSVPIYVGRLNSGSTQPTSAYTKNITATINTTSIYNEGYDADHSMFIGDYDIVAIPSSKTLSLGQSLEIWPYFKKKDGEYQWGPKYTISAPTDPHPTRFQLRCTGATPVYPGSNINNYTFTIQSPYSFSVDTNYNFYR